MEKCLKMLITIKRFNGVSLSIPQNVLKPVYKFSWGSAPDPIPDIVVHHLPKKALKLGNNEARGDIKKA